MLSPKRDRAVAPILLGLLKFTDFLLQDRNMLAQFARDALAQPWRIAIYNTTIVMLCMAH